jgi:hypothetical protein
MSVAEDSIVMISVDSSSIASYAWDAKQKSDGTLFLKFKNGLTYKYLNVSNEVFNGFVNAESKGKFFASSIRNKFTTTKM